MTWVYSYTSIAAMIGGLFFWRNRGWRRVDAEFVFLSVGVGVLWPIAIVLDVAHWWSERR